MVGETGAQRVAWLENAKAKGKRVPVQIASRTTH
jgi:hypothetical protein